MIFLPHLKYDEKPEVSLRVYGVPAPQGSKSSFIIPGRNGAKAKAVVVDGSSAVGREKHSSWRAEVAREAFNERPDEILDGALWVDIIFYLPRPVSIPKRRLFPNVKPDVDKLVRATFDSMTKVLYADDARIVGTHTSKRYATSDNPPGAIIRIYKLIEEAESHS